jgi:hypothetical protein
LAQPDVCSVVGRPWKSQQIALPLTGPKRQKCGHRDAGRPDRKEPRNIIFSPYLFRSVSLIESAAALAGIHRDAPTIMRDGKNTGERCPSVIGLAWCVGHAVPPSLEFTTNLGVRKRLDWHVAKFGLDHTKVGGIGTLS